METIATRVQKTLVCTQHNTPKLFADYLTVFSIYGERTVTIRSNPHAHAPSVHAAANGWRAPSGLQTSSQ